MAGVDEVLDEAARGVIDVMAWNTLRRRAPEMRTGGGRCDDGGETGLCGCINCGETGLCGCD